MNRQEVYIVSKSMGIFADETEYKKKLSSSLLKGTNGFNAYKKVFSIENAEEPGMPDLLVLDIDDTARFIEVKYARKGVIKFKKTQLPWYKRHKDLNIVIVAYNDLTQNQHVIPAEYLLTNTKSTSFRLRDEKELI